MASKKTFWILVSNRWYSAITAYAIATAKALQQLNHNCVITPLWGSPGHKHAEKAGLSVQAFKSFGLSQAKACRKAYQDLKPDAIFVFGGPETTLMFCLPKSAYVVRFRGQDKELEKNHRFLSLTHSRVDSVLTPSKTYTTFFKQKYHTPVHTVPYGLSEKDFYFEDIKKDDRPVILLVGRLDPIKGHREFFEYYKKLMAVWPRENKKPLLRIVGQKANLAPEDLEQYASNLGLRDGLDYELVTERVGDLRAMMNRASVGLISSLGSEIICRVGAEFLMCGTPVMVRGVGSLRELLFDGAGISYEDEGYERADICRFIWDAFEEPAAARRQRQDRARGFFSLDAMGACLMAALPRG